MQGDTAEEIARKQGVTETAIRIRLLRARRAARAKAERKPVPASKLLLATRDAA
jgi:DNA-directed RNA polymerase specialized sigma24 family protein